MIRDFQAQLNARPVSRQLAKTVRGMPYKEAVFVIDKALDFINVQLDTHAPYDVTDQAYIEYEQWVNNLDPNSKTIIKQVEYRILVALAEGVKNNRRKGVADRREHPW